MTWNLIHSVSLPSCFITRDGAVSQLLKFGSAFLSYFSWESKIALLCGMTWSANVLNSGAHSFRIFESQKLPCFLTFSYPVPVPEKLCDFHWLQLRITCKSGWIAQAENRYFVSKEGKRLKECALTTQDLPSGDWKYCLGCPAGRHVGVVFLIYSQKSRRSRILLAKS